MKTIVCFFLCVIVLLPLSSQQKTQLETDTFRKYADSDKRLNEIYQQVLSSHKKDSVFTANLKTAQRLWIRFRDAQLSVRFPDTNQIQNNRSQLFYRTAYDLRLIDARIKELQEYLVGVIDLPPVSLKDFVWYNFPEAVQLAEQSNKNIIVLFRSNKSPEDSAIKRILRTDEVLNNYLHDHFVMVSIYQSLMEYKRKNLRDLLSTKIALAGSDPSFVFFSTHGDMICNNYGSNLNVQRLYDVCTYVNGEYYLKQSVPDYLDDLLRKSKNKPSLNWYSYNEGMEMAKITGKRIVINAHAKWSHYCMRMKNSTYSDTAVINYINGNFIPIQVELWTEYSNFIDYDNKKISANELLTKIYGVKGFPETIFCESDGKKIDFLSGFYKPDVFLPVLHYFGEGIYNTENMDMYLAGKGLKR